MFLKYFGLNELGLIIGPNKSGGLVHSNVPPEIVYEISLYDSMKLRFIVIYVCEFLVVFLSPPWSNLWGLVRFFGR